MQKELYKPTVELKEQTSSHEVIFHALSSGETLAVFAKDGSMTSWLKIGPGEDLATVSIEQNLIDSAWVKERVGEINPQDLTLLIRSDRSDAICIDPEIPTIDINSKKYVLSDKIETGTDPKSNTDLLITQKQRVKEKLSVAVNERILESEDQQAKSRIVSLGTLENGYRVFYIPVDKEIEDITKIDGDTTAESQQFNPNKAKSLDDTGRIKLHPEGDSIIVVVLPDGTHNFVSSNFGKVTTIASSIMEVNAGGTKGTINKVIDKTCEEKGIDKKDLGSHKKQIKSHLTRKIISCTNSISGRREIPNGSLTFDLQSEKEKRLSRYPEALIQTLNEEWYSSQIALNQSQIGNNPSVAEIASKFGEPVAEYLLCNPDKDKCLILAEYKLLTIDLPAKTNEMIRKAGLGLLGDSVNEVIGGLYLEYFNSITSTDWDNIVEIAQSFDERYRSSILNYSRELTKQGGNLKIRQRTFARYLASIGLESIVTSLGETQFDAYKITQDVPDQEVAIKLAVQKKVDSDDQLLTLKAIFDRIVATSQTKELGQISVSINIKSLTEIEETVDGESKTRIQNAEFKTLPEYKTAYPKIVIDALKELYAEYNEAFRRLVQNNTEFENDYMFALDKNGMPINGWVQIDMVGLPDGFLQMAESMSKDEVKSVLRSRIFEIENSLAMYQLLMKIFSNNVEVSRFEKRFRQSLDEVRKRHSENGEKKEIILLAVTDQKYNAMRQSEFGKQSGEGLSDQEVMELSGFDMFMGPKEFKAYVEENGGKCPALIYARTSDPTNKLADPDYKVEGSLLENEDLRRIIKQNSITFNIDDPKWDPNSEQRINDTKGYLESMGMAIEVNSIEDVLSDGVEQYLLEEGVHPALVEHGMAVIRAKPRVGTYGCYGHHRLDFTNGRDRNRLAEDIEARGGYVVQPEMSTPHITNTFDGRTYAYIDRVFFTTNGMEYKFMGGFRSMMPTDTNEYASGRNHGSDDTTWAEIQEGE
jgi:hypothetical protein